MTTWTEPGTGALTAGARRLADLAADVRRHAAELTLAASSAGWRSAAAEACRARLADTGRDLLASATLLDHAADALADHARATAHRAAVLEQTAAGLLTTGARELTRWIT